MGTPEPKRLGEGAMARVARILAARGIDPAAVPDPDTDEPHPGLAAAEARIPLRYRHAVAEHPQVAAWVRAVATRAASPSKGARRLAATGPSVLLLGTTGTGKTHQAYGAIRSLTATGIGVRWQATTEADLYASLRPRPGGDTERELMTIARCPVLILDDLGAAKGSEWTEELLYRLINKRYNDVLPTLITTNLAIRDLRQSLGDRIASRLAEMTERVVLAGADRRRVRAA
ncbi:ATP-binding protein [Streptomyces aidingensis]|uniref:DNA replication protein DnaC n=1 Tax=Streptomyces aidingensis TaxID=910347 RepID=A0A1I1KM53_9ACTN|nr:ATP-binding protein [Streptomyces aidingensis]SFC59183.1 DNA replication protein DnaC [Streptomyces aidingensis]